MPTKLKSIKVGDDLNDTAFAEAIERLTCLVEAGEHQRAAEFIDQNPEHADALRRLLPAIEALASLDDSAVRGSPDPAHPASSFQDPASGAGQLGDFRILREIGRGGMGVVYEATQISLNRRVALKVLPLAAMLDARRLERFRHEAQAAGMLRHPHIVSVFSVGCERGVHYYAMDFIEGPSLAEVVEQARTHRDPHPAPSARAASLPPAPSPRVASLPAPSPRRGGLGRGGRTGKMRGQHPGTDPFPSRGGEQTSRYRHAAGRRTIHAPHNATHRILPRGRPTQHPSRRGARLCAPDGRRASRREAVELAH